MKVTGSQRPAARKGFTTLEIIFVVAILSLIVVAIAPFFRATVAGWDLKDRQLEILQNGRVGMDEMVRAIKTAKRFTTIDASYIEFMNTDNTEVEFRLFSGVLQKKETGTQWDTLAEPLTDLTFTYYDADDNPITPDTGVTGEVRSVEIVMVVSDSEGEVPPVTFTSRVTVRKDLLSLAINEINYNPLDSGKKEREREWIELYNFSSNPIDVNGWKLEVEAGTYTIEGWQGVWPTIIPVGGYAIITTNETKVYVYYGEPPFGTIRLQGDTRNLRLHNTQDEIILLDTDGVGVLVRPVRYYDSWNSGGEGDTLERKDEEWAPNDQNNWEAGTVTLTHTMGYDNTTGSYP